MDIPKRPLVGCGCNSDCCQVYKCPKCKEELSRAEGVLSCRNGCYDNEVDLWESLMARGYQ